MSHAPYEIHVTMARPLGAIEIVFDAIAEALSWHTSHISDDPDLGPGDRFYFTTHTETEDEAHQRIDELVEALALHGAEPLREKIEHVVFDTKRGDRAPGR